MLCLTRSETKGDESTDENSDDENDLEDETTEDKNAEDNKNKPPKQLFIYTGVDKASKKLKRPTDVTIFFSSCNNIPMYYLVF